MQDKPAGDREYGISELEEVSGIPRRTIHYYIARDLLPSAEGSGLGARYGEVHVLRLKVIELLKTLGLKLESIRGVLDSMTPEQLRETFEEAERHPSKLVYLLQRKMAHQTLMGIMDDLGEHETLRVRALAEDEPDGAAAIGGLEDLMDRPRSRSRTEPHEVSRRMPAPDTSAPSAPVEDEAYLSAQSELEETTTWRRMQVTPDLEIHYRHGRDSGFTTKLKAVVGLIRGMFTGDDDPAPPDSIPQDAGKKGGKKKDAGKKDKKKKG